MGLEAVAELVQRAVHDTAIVRALGDAPDELATLVDLSPEELQALRATTSLTGPEQRAFVAATPTADSGTGLLPPQGSGVPAATPVAGITGLPGAPPPSPPVPQPPSVGPSPQPPVIVAPGPGPAPPQPPVVPPPVVPPGPPPTMPSSGGQGQLPPAAPAGPADRCRCRGDGTTAVAAVAIVANTAISAIAAIAAMPCGRRCDDRPTTNPPRQGDR